MNGSPFHDDELIGGGGAAQAGIIGCTVGEDRGQCPLPAHWRDCRVRSATRVARNQSALSELERHHLPVDRTLCRRCCGERPPDALYWAARPSKSAKPPGRRAIVVTARNSRLDNRE